ncbi:MAG TPA: TRAP transporter large permease subunit [Hyphomicrobiaceae bacterium]|jgi:TRAP-type mannitol/chloroaromatic compound transport system permease large subunit|nr:TRAP transporter large permease subunit [Hyphomicrobiaceae bacterium]
MAALIAENMAPIMFSALIVFLLLGYPVAFALGAVGLIFFAVGVELAPLSKGAINLSWPLLRSLPERIFGIVSNDTLLAIPFFTFMGLILERSRMAEDLLDTIGQLFGTIRGGLAYAVVFVGALLAATTGVVAASVISMGLISLPIMLRYGYDRRLASGVIAASGTLAQIIPPSLVLIVLADQLGRSVGDMYEGAFVPGILLAGLYALYVFAVTMLFPDAAPGLPRDAIGFKESDGSRGLTSLLFLTVVAGVIGWSTMQGRGYKGADFVILSMAVAIMVAFAIAVSNWVIGKITGFRFLSRLAQQVTFVMVPPLFLIFLVLGTIFIGVATPTEGGAMGAVGAMLLAFARRFIDRDPRRFNFALVKSAAESTAKLSAFVLFILIGARIFSLTFYGVNGHVWVEHLLTSLPGGHTGFLVFVNVLVFLLAFFLDFFELAFIIIPLLAPAAEKLGIDLIWLGVMLGVNLQTSFMHPPFGFALFYLRSVAPREPFKDNVSGLRTEPVTTAQIYWGAVPFVVIQCIMAALVILFPGMVMHYKAATPQLDPSKIEIQIPGFGGPQSDTGAPSFGPGPAPPTAPPSFGEPPSLPSGPPAVEPPSTGEPRKPN